VKPLFLQDAVLFRNESFVLRSHCESIHLLTLLSGLQFLRDEVSSRRALPALYAVPPLCLGQVKRGV